MEDKFEVEIYERNDKKPFIKFYEELNRDDKSRVLRYLDLLEAKGNKIDYHYSKKLDKHIYELRITESRTNIRILYFYTKDRRIVITNAFIKKTQKTPRKEILLANIYRIDWIERRTNNET